MARTIIVHVSERFFERNSETQVKCPNPECRETLTVVVSISSTVVCSKCHETATFEFDTRSYLQA